MAGGRVRLCGTKKVGLKTHRAWSGHVWGPILACFASPCTKAEMGLGLKRRDEVLFFFLTFLARLI